MRSIDVESAIAEFMSVGRRLQEDQPLTGERVLNDLSTWYRDTRIEGATIDEDGDMLLLQWGALRPLIVAEPTDLRAWTDDDLRFAEHEVRYLDVTRQVFVAGEDDEAEFDDEAVQMSITLGFEPADGSEPSSNLWIHSPTDLEKGIQTFRNTPFVQSYLRVPSQSITILIDHCG